MEKLSEYGPTFPREQTTNLALAQIGWIGKTGSTYPLRQTPTQSQEPDGHTPLLIPTGTWKNLGNETWTIND